MFNTDVSKGCNMQSMLRHIPQFEEHAVGHSLCQFLRDFDATPQSSGIYNHSCIAGTYDCLRKCLGTIQHST